MDSSKKKKTQVDDSRGQNWQVIEMERNGRCLRWINEFLDDMF